MSFVTLFPPSEWKWTNFYPQFFVPTEAWWCSTVYEVSSSWSWCW